MYVRLQKKVLPGFEPGLGGYFTSYERFKTACDNPYTTEPTTIPEANKCETYR